MLRAHQIKASSLTGCDPLIVGVTVTYVCHWHVFEPNRNQMSIDHHVCQCIG